jgi:uncharacterized protein
MKLKLYSEIKAFVFSQKYDLVHDERHILRVLFHALDIASDYKIINYDILIAACLLHDIGRSEKYRQNSIPHALSGAKISYDFLMNIGQNSIAQMVCDCVRTHSFRGTEKPLTIEAKILYDADKIELTGSIGIARAFQFQSKLEEPLYNIDDDYGDILFESNKPSFINTYHKIIEGVNKTTFTEKGKQLLLRYSKNAEIFYNNLINEIDMIYKSKDFLQKIIID